MGRKTVLCPEFGPLVHPEAVLLVDYGKPQVFEHDLVLKQGVGAYDKAYVPVCKAFEDFPARLGAGRSCEQGAAHACGGEVFLNVAVMLLREHFGRGHDAALVAVPNRQQAAEHGDHGLARAHVSLQEPVHLLPGHQVRAYLLDDPLLGTGEPVGKGVVAGVEVWPHLWHKYTLVGAGAYVLLLEQAELKQEEFFELEAAGGLLKRVGV